MDAEPGRIALKGLHRGRGPKPPPQAVPTAICRLPGRPAHAFFAPAPCQGAPKAKTHHGRRSALPCFGTGKSPYLEQKWNKVLSTKPLAQHALALKWCQLTPNGALRTWLDLLLAPPSRECPSRPGSFSTPSLSQDSGREPLIHPARATARRLPPSIGHRAPPAAGHPTAVHPLQCRCPLHSLTLDSRRVTQDPSATSASHPNRQCVTRASLSPLNALGFG